MKEESPVFIVGMPRSGTTLLRSALTSHPAIRIGPETHFLSHWVPRFGGEIRTPEDFERFWAAFRESRPFEELDLDAEVMYRALTANGTPGFRDVLRGLLAEDARRHGKARWGEKTPAHHAHLDTLLDWFPDARVLYVVRDPRAVTASLMDVPWAESRIEVHAGRWRDSVRILRQWEGDARVLVVYYEALVTDAEATLRGICDFIGEPFDEAMLSRRDTALTEVGPAGWVRQHKRRAMGPITPSSLTRWRSRLSHRQVATVEYLTRRGMRRHGYRMMTSGPGAVAWSALMVHRLLDRVRREIIRLRGGAPAAPPQPAARPADDAVRTQRRRVS